MRGDSAGLAEPPEGVLAGESIPRVNEGEDVEQAKVDEMAGTLKSRPEFQDHSDEELEEIARRKLRRSR